MHVESERSEVGGDAARATAEIGDRTATPRPHRLGERGEHRPVPRPGAELTAAGVQLAAYRLGWSRLTGVPVDRVSAGFHHVAAQETLRPVDLLDEAGLLALVTGAEA